MGLHFCLESGEFMLYKLPSRQRDHMIVVFELAAFFWIKEIFLVGEFNGWSEEATPLWQANSGSWRAVLELPKGRRYEYRYRIGCYWYTDYQADQVVPNCQHSQNSVLFTQLSSAAYDTIHFSSAYYADLQALDLAAGACDADACDVTDSLTPQFAAPFLHRLS
jgi:hypothetical protein